VKVGKFEVGEWKRYPSDRVCYRMFRDPLMSGPDLEFEGLALFPIKFDGDPLFQRTNWILDFYGPFDDHYGKFQNWIQFNPTDTEEEAKKKVDDLLDKIARFDGKLEAFE